MYLGKVVEIADVQELYEHPRHPYTQALIAAMPSVYADGEQLLLQGDLPNQLAVPEGCSVHTRCPRATELCKTQAPILQNSRKNHAVSCHYCQ